MNIDRLESIESSKTILHIFFISLRDIDTVCSISSGSLSLLLLVPLSFSQLLSLLFYQLHSLFSLFLHLMVPLLIYLLLSPISSFSSLSAISLLLSLYIVLLSYTALNSSLFCSPHSSFSEDQKEERN